MAVNWVLPVRGVQAALSVTVLGLMAYGLFFSWIRYIYPNTFQWHLGGHHTGGSSHQPKSIS